MQEEGKMQYKKLLGSDIMILLAPRRLKGLLTESSTYMFNIVYGLKLTN